MEPKETDKLQAEIAKEYNFAPSAELRQLAEQLWDEEEKKSTPEHVIRTQVMDPRIPKNEREWWAFRRIKELEHDCEFYRALLAIVHREYVGYADPEPETDDQAIAMMAMEFKDELPHQISDDS